jgi:hypothetical protein
LQFLAGDYFAGAFQQQSKNLEGLSLQTHFYAAFTQFTGAQVELEYSEARDPAVVLRHDAVV